MTAASPAEPAASRRALFWEVFRTVVLAASIFLLVRSVVQNFRVDGLSMEPNFHSGEYILVERFDYLLHPPQRGDVIVFRAVPAREPHRDFIKRVIGLPGDTVAIHDRKVFVNGRALPERYIPDPPRYTFAPVTVPKNDYFVLGDNRNNSYDSSRWSATPFLARRYIIGKAWVAYWPPRDLTVIREPSYASHG